MIILAEKAPLYGGQAVVEGVWLQFFTTKEPNNLQIEVSIAAFYRMKELDEYPEQIVA